MNPNEERIAQAQLDLREVQAQLAAGELDRATADRLIDTYTDEIEGLQHSDDIPADEPSRRSWRRAIVGVAIVTAAVASITVAVVQAATERNGGFITGTGAEATGVDLESISNETMAEVIAANPDNPQINQMRLSLADRFFEEGNQQEAFQWYDEVLQNEPSSVEASEALGRIGWLVHASGDSALAEETLLRALELVPGNIDARFFLGRVYADTGRPEAARAEWLVIAGDESLPGEIRDVAQEAIDALDEP